MGELNKFLFLTILFLYFFKYSSEQIIIPINPINEEDGPTIVTRETFTVQSNDGTPIRVTRIGFHKNSKNLNGGGMRLTPLDLMRLMDDRIDSIFEEIISQRIGLNILYNNNNNNNIEKEENKEEDNKNKDNKTNDEEKDKNKENQEIIDDKEFELDEKEENTNDKIIEQNKTEEIKNEEIKNEEIKNEDNKENKDNKVNIENKNKENKENKNNKIDNNKKEKKEKKEKKSDDKKKTIGKLKVNADTLKPKKKKKKLSTKEIIFSRICKYIFYSIILFTIYILIRKLLELLDIIDPETNKVNKDVKVNNNQEEKKDDESKKKENDIIINKKKENNKLN